GKLRGPTHGAGNPGSLDAAAIIDVRSRDTSEDTAPAILARPRLLAAEWNDTLDDDAACGPNWMSCYPMRKATCEEIKRSRQLQ
ncbi:hypothetical protein MTO96_041963, partial [Rhipicephalus appendiculatus]